LAVFLVFSTFARIIRRMKPVLLSTAYLPPISWMAAALHSGRIELEIYETYPKQTFRNRCNIATSSGMLSLTVPVSRINGSHTKTCDIRIDNSNNWQLLHWRSIVTAYNKSPYFLFYRDLIKPVYFIKHERLIDLNHEILNILLNGLKINYLNIFHTSQFDVKPDAYDLRNSFHPVTKPNQVIKFDLPRYIQAFESKHGYLPDLSIIDLLFNLGPDAVSYLSDVKLSYDL
jgi:hypothetical protein